MANIVISKWTRQSRRYSRGTAQIRRGFD